MTYTINGKEWTEFDINKRCAKLMGIDCSGITEIIQLTYGIPVSYCTKPSEAWPIIEKCWDDLNKFVDIDGDGVTHETFGEWEFEPVLSKWNYIMNNHKCTKLIAACICYIEMQEEV
tara:strand:- start:73 stop:423 length:351 start_codon:yes stop_codon:yes gene_type:complete